MGKMGGTKAQWRVLSFNYSKGKREVLNVF